MGDMLAGGFFLGLAGFFAGLAAVDTGNPYGPMGASRTRMVGFLAEPVFMIVFFTVSFVAQSTIPYIVQKKWVASPAAFFSPSHILLLIAFFMLILAEGGKIPVDNPTGHFELAMIDESKGLEYSGRGAALMKWGGADEVPGSHLHFPECTARAVGAGPWSAAWRCLACCAVDPYQSISLQSSFWSMIESSLAKLRLFRISEFLGAAFIISVAAMIASIFSVSVSRGRG